MCPSLNIMEQDISLIEALCCGKYEYWEYCGGEGDYFVKGLKLDKDAYGFKKGNVIDLGFELESLEYHSNDGTTYIKGKLVIGHEAPS